MTSICKPFFHPNVLKKTLKKSKPTNKTYTNNKRYEEKIWDNSFNTSIPTLKK